MTVQRDEDTYRVKRVIAAVKYSHLSFGQELIDNLNEETPEKLPLKKSLSQ